MPLLIVPLLIVLGIVGYSIGGNALKSINLSLFDSTPKTSIIKKAPALKPAAKPVTPKQGNQVASGNLVSPAKPATTSSDIRPENSVPRDVDGEGVAPAVTAPVAQVAPVAASAPVAPVAVAPSAPSAESGIKVSKGVPIFTFAIIPDWKEPKQGYEGSFSEWLARYAGKKIRVEGVANLALFMGTVGTTHFLSNPAKGIYDDGAACHPRAVGEDGSDEPPGWVIGKMITVEGTVMRTYTRSQRSKMFELYSCSVVSVAQ